MSLGSLHSAALSLLDVLVCDHGGSWVARKQVDQVLQMQERTAYRGWMRLHDFRLVELRPSKYRPAVRATPLGQRFIAAQYEERRERSAS
jgi:hypothetical protein